MGQVTHNVFRFNPSSVIYAVAAVSCAMIFASRPVPETTTTTVIHNHMDGKKSTRVIQCVANDCHEVTAKRK